MINKLILTASMFAAFTSTSALALCSISPFEGEWYSSNGGRFLMVSARCETKPWGADVMVYDIESHLGKASSYNVYGGEMTVVYPEGTQTIKLTSDSSVEIQTREIFRK